LSPPLSVPGSAAPPCAPTPLTGLRFSRQMLKLLARLGASFLRGTRSSPRGSALRRRRSRGSSHTHSLVAAPVKPGHTSPISPPCLPGSPAGSSPQGLVPSVLAGEAMIGECLLPDGSPGAPNCACPELASLGTRRWVRPSTCPPTPASLIAATGI
jgi:hypothetical protein